MQDIIQMCSSFDASKSTKGASKLRRDLINTEIGHLRDLLPLPASTRQRLSQLQLMALVCVYVRKANYFQQVFKRHDLGQMPTPSIGFSKAMNGFLMMMTQNGKLLYISDNAAEYLGHSMEDLLIHGDSVYDIIDKQDHQSVQSELARPPGSGGAGLQQHQHQQQHDDGRLFLCRMNVSRNARRQMRFGDQKVILVEGHFVSYLPLCTRNEPVLIATCTPVAMPETRECVVQGATNIFTSVHSMDMKFASIDASGEFYLGYSRQELVDVSWYQLLHWDYMREAQSKHRLITQSEQDRSCILLVRLQRRNGTWLWIHCVLQVKDASEAGQQPVIVCTNQVLSEREAQVMRANSWLYHYYLVQTKLQYGMNYEGQQASGGTSRSSAASASSPGGASFGYQPAMSNNSPGPSSSCSASGETPTTPQPVPFQQPQQLIPPPITSPLYAPPPPPPHHLHPHGHLYAAPGIAETYHHFPMHSQQAQPPHQSAAGAGAPASGNYAFSPSPGPGHHQGYLGGSFPLAPQNSYQHLHSLPAHHQAHLIKSESFNAAEPAELGAYQVKAETKLDEYNTSVVDGASGAMYGGGVNSVKEEPNGQPMDDPTSPVPSPPRKRYRLMATSLPSIGPPSFPSNGGSGGEHQPGHHDQTQHHQQDWHRNHRSDHHTHSGYGQWPSTGWINSSYPVGLTQLDEAGFEAHEQYEREDTFSPLVSLAASSSPGSPLRIHQRRTLFRRKQYASAIEPPTSMSVIRHHLAESVQRVPDVSTTMLPELSPLGYVLTPAPTPPDAEEASVGFAAEANLAGVAETEQRVPVSEPTDACVGPQHYATSLPTYSTQAVEHSLLVTLPAVNHTYVYQTENGIQPLDSAPMHHNDVNQDHQEPKTPPSMHSL